MEGIDWPLVGTQAGFGAVLGFAVGYTAKKALKIAFIVGGILLLVLLALQNFGLISIEWARIQALYSETLNPPQGLGAALRGWVDSLAAMIPGATGFTVGFFWGLKKG